MSATVGGLFGQTDIPEPPDDLLKWIVSLAFIAAVLCALSLL